LNLELQLRDQRLRESRDAAGSSLSGLQCLDPRRLPLDFQLQIDWPDRLECWSGGFSQGDLWNGVESADDLLGFSAAAAGGRVMINGGFLRALATSRCKSGTWTFAWMSSSSSNWPEAISSIVAAEICQLQKPCTEKESSCLGLNLAREKVHWVLRLFRLLN